MEAGRGDEERAASGGPVGGPAGGGAGVGVGAVHGLAVVVVERDGDLGRVRIRTVKGDGHRALHADKLAVRARLDQNVDARAAARAVGCRDRGLYRGVGAAAIPRDGIGGSVSAGRGQSRRRVPVVTHQRPGRTGLRQVVLDGEASGRGIRKQRPGLRPRVLGCAGHGRGSAATSASCAARSGCPAGCCRAPGRRGSAGGCRAPASRAASASGSPGCRPAAGSNCATAGSNGSASRTSIWCRAARRRDSAGRTAGGCRATSGAGSARGCRASARLSSPGCRGPSSRRGSAGHQAAPGRNASPGRDRATGARRTAAPAFPVGGAGAGGNPQCDDSEDRETIHGRVPFSRG